MEQLPEASGPGSVLLDIGGEVGAAAVHVPASLAGAELEIRPVGEPWSGAHVAVRERLLPAASVWVAMFPALASGRYEVRVRGRGHQVEVCLFSVRGGAVSTVHAFGAVSRG